MKRNTCLNIMTEGGPSNGSMFLAYYLWREAFRFREMGRACTIARALFMVILVLTLLIFRTSRKWVYYEGEWQ